MMKGTEVQVKALKEDLAAGEEHLRESVDALLKACDHLDPACFLEMFATIHRHFSWLRTQEMQVRNMGERLTFSSTPSVNQPTIFSYRLWSENDAWPRDKFFPKKDLLAELRDTPVSVSKTPKMQSLLQTELGANNPIVAPSDRSSSRIAIGPKSKLASK